MMTVAQLQAMNWSFLIEPNDETFSLKFVGGVGWSDISIVFGIMVGGTLFLEEGTRFFYSSIGMKT